MDNQSYFVKKIMIEGVRKYFSRFFILIFYDSLQWQLSFQDQMATQVERLSSSILKTLCIFWTVESYRNDELERQFILL